MDKKWQYACEYSEKSLHKGQQITGALACNEMSSSLA